MCIKLNLTIYNNLISNCTLISELLQVDPQTRFNALPANSSLLTASSSNLSASTNSLTGRGSSSGGKRLLSTFKSALSASMQHLAAAASSKHSTRPQPPSVTTTPPSHQTAGARASLAPSPLSSRAEASRATVCPPGASGPHTVPQLYDRRSPSPQLASRMSISPASASPSGDVALSHEFAGRFTRRPLDDASDDERLAQQRNTTKLSGSTHLGRLKLPGWRSTGSSSATSFSTQQPQSPLVFGRCSSSSDEDEPDLVGRATRSSNDTLKSDMLHDADGTTIPPPPRPPRREVR